MRVEISHLFCKHHHRTQKPSAAMTFPLRPPFHFHISILAYFHTFTFPHWQHFPRSVAASVGRAVPASRNMGGPQGETASHVPRTRRMPLAIGNIGTGNISTLATFPHWQHFHIGNIFTTCQKLFRARPCATRRDLINYCHQPARLGLSGA